MTPRARSERAPRLPSAWAVALLLVSGVAAAQAPAAAEPKAAPAAASKSVGIVDIDDFLPKQQAGEGAVFTRNRCIELTLKNYPRIHEARARLEYRKQQEVQSWSAPYSEFNVTGGLGLAPQVRGTPLYTPDTDVALSKHMGVGWSI